MKHIDEHYKDWCGESHTTNSCHPVHDSAECIDFAQYYAKQMQDHTIDKMNELRDEYQRQVYELAPFSSNLVKCTIMKCYEEVIKELNAIIEKP